jgi:hypothetical protein
MARLKACPDTNLRGEGKMPSRQPAGPFGFAQGRLPALQSFFRACKEAATFRSGQGVALSDRVWVVPGTG